MPNPFHVAPVEDPRDWWNKNVTPNNMPRFIFSIGKEQEPQRQRMCNFLRKHNFKSMIDCGCGPRYNFLSLKEFGVDIEYTGLDVTDMFLDDLTEAGGNALKADITSIPMPDRSYDVSYARQVFEHLEDWKKALSEMIRVADRCVCVAFHKEFNVRTKYRKNAWGLINRRFRKADIEAELNENSRVESFKWTQERTLIVWLRRGFNRPT